MDVEWTPLPSPQQVWAHSCCSRSSLKTALQDPTVTAIEADILMGRVGTSELIPIMAHPPNRTSDLSFNDFWDACLSEARHHVKLDFKDLKSLQLCLPTVTASQRRFCSARSGHVRARAVWINADILPGPNRRGESCPIPAEEFVEAVLTHCPGVPLSLGWRVSTGFESYSLEDMSSMLKVCQALPLHGVVFAASARLALRNPRPLIELLQRKPASQLLLWTGTGEAPISSQVLESLSQSFAEVQGRVGYDCKVTESRFEGWLGELTICIAQLWRYLCNWTRRITRSIWRKSGTS